MTIRWKLGEIMARHNVKAKEIAQKIGVCEETVGKWKREAPPFCRWDEIAAAITTYSRSGDQVYAIDFLEEAKTQFKERSDSSGTTEPKLPPEK